MGQSAALLCTGQEGGRPSPPFLSNDKTLRGYAGTDTAILWEVELQTSQV